MVLRVTGRVGDRHGPSPPAVEALAARQDAQLRLRDRDDLAPEALHVVAVEARRRWRRASTGRRGAALRARARRHDVRPAPHERAGRAGVVEVDVRQQDAPAARGRRAPRRSASSHDCGPGIDEDVADAAAADDVRAPEVQDVELLVAGGRHRRATRMSGNALVSSRGVHDPWRMPTVLNPASATPVQQPFLVDGEGRLPAVLALAAGRVVVGRRSRSRRCPGRARRARRRRAGRRSRTAGPRRSSRGAPRAGGRRRRRAAGA